MKGKCCWCGNPIKRGQNVVTVEIKLDISVRIDAHMHPMCHRKAWLKLDIGEYPRHIGFTVKA